MGRYLFYTIGDLTYQSPLVCKELPRSTLDTDVLSGTQIRGTGSELQGKFIHIWSGAG